MAREERKGASSAEAREKRERPIGSQRRPAERSGAGGASGPGRSGAEVSGASARGDVTVPGRSVPPRRWFMRSLALLGPLGRPASLLPCRLSGEVLGAAGPGGWPVSEGGAAPPHPGAGRGRACPQRSGAPGLREGGPARTPREAAGGGSLRPRRPLGRGRRPRGERRPWLRVGGGPFLSAPLPEPPAAPQPGLPPGLRGAASGAGGVSASSVSPLCVPPSRRCPRCAPHGRAGGTRGPLARSGQTRLFPNGVRVKRRRI